MRKTATRSLGAFVVAVVVGVLAESAPADIITHNFTGTITSVAGTPFGLGPDLLGQQVQGRFTYDAGRPPTSATGDVAGYIQLAPSGMSMVVSGLIFRNGDVSSFQVADSSFGADNFNGFFPLISVDGVPQPGSFMAFSLTDFSQAALPGTALPPALDVASFGQRGGNVFDGAGPGFLGFSIDSLEVAGPQLVPGAVKAWIGLKKSDAVGLRLDVQAEVRVDGDVVGVGHVTDVWAGSSGFNNALLHTITLDGEPVLVPDGALLEVRVSVRRTCAGGGHASGVARFWLDGPAIDTGVKRNAGSRLEATLDAVAVSEYLRTGFSLSEAAGAARTFQDVMVNSAEPCPERRFMPFGSWSGALP